MRRFLVLLLLAACGTAAEPLPDGVLAREPFTALLTDMTLTEARMNHEITSMQIVRPPMSRYYADILRAHGTDSLTFRRSFDHYAMRPEEMKGIYDDVLERIRVMKDEALQADSLAKDTTFATDSSSVRNR